MEVRDEEISNEDEHGLTLTAKAMSSLVQIFPMGWPRLLPTSTRRRKEGLLPMMD